MKCKIRWINFRGIETPDNNEAIGIAKCLTALDNDGDNMCYPICAEHANIMLKFSNWKLIPFEDDIKAVIREFGVESAFGDNHHMFYDYQDKIWKFRFYRNEFDVRAGSVIW